MLCTIITSVYVDFIKSVVLWAVCNIIILTISWPNLANRYEPAPLLLLITCLKQPSHLLSHSLLFCALFVIIILTISWPNLATLARPAAALDHMPKTTITTCSKSISRRCIRISNNNYRGASCFRLCMIRINMMACHRPIYSLHHQQPAIHQSFSRCFDAY